MIELTAVGKVWYYCKLNAEDEELVLKYAKENNCDIEDAVKELYWHGELNIYDISAESDYSTEEIYGIEYEGEDEE